MLLSDVPAIAEGIAALTKIEPAFATALAENGPLPYRLQPGGFGGFIRIILGQQVSTLAADAMWRKLELALPEVTPEAMLAADDETLRACGFSRQKIAYARGLANDILTGALDLAGLATMDDEAAIAAIIRCHGLGRWTAENYLMFCTGRGDLFPAKDLGILIGLQMIAGGDSRPTPIEAWSYAERWRPYRSAASLLIWHYYTLEVARRRKVKDRAVEPPAA